MNEMKMVILLRRDLKMPPGKAVAQGSHASVDAVLKSDKKLVNEWKEQGMKKVVLKVNSEKEMINYLSKAKRKGLKCALVIDAGRTFFKGATKTCIAIGPDEVNKLDWITGELKLY